MIFNLLQNEKRTAYTVPYPITKVHRKLFIISDYLPAYIYPYPVKQIPSPFLSAQNLNKLLFLFPAFPHLILSSLTRSVQNAFICFYERSRYVFPTILS